MPSIHQLLIHQCIIHPCILQFTLNLPISQLAKHFEGVFTAKLMNELGSYLADDIEAHFGCPHSSLQNILALYPLGRAIRFRFHLLNNHAND